MTLRSTDPHEGIAPLRCLVSVLLLVVIFIAASSPLCGGRFSDYPRLAPGTLAPVLCRTIPSIPPPAIPWFSRSDTLVSVLSSLPSLITTIAHPLVLAAAQGTPLTFAMTGHFTAQHSYPIAATLGWMSNETLSGVAAAFAEQNARGGIGGRNFSLRLVEDNAITDLAAQQANAAAMSAPDVLGAIAPSAQMAFVVNPIGRALGVPVFGPTTISQTDLEASTPNSDYLLHTRATLASEGAAMLNFAVNSALHCNTFMVVYIDDFGIPEHAQLIRSELLRLGFGEPGMTHFPNGNDPNFNAAYPRALGVYRNMTVRPNCFLFLTDAGSTLPLIKLVLAEPGVDADETFFITTSAATVPRWVDTTTGRSDLYRNVFIGQPYPSGLDTRYAVINSYRAAMTALKASGSHSVDATYAPNVFAVDGYVAGRFVIETVNRIGLGATPSRQALKDAVYRTRTFPIDDLVLGPYSSKCVGQQTAATGPCFCTTGMRKLFFARADGTTGLPVPVFDNEYYPGVAEVPIPLDQCDLTSAYLKAPLLALIPKDMALTATPAAAIQDGIAAAIRRKVAAARVANQLDHGPLFVVQRSAAPFNRSTLASLDGRYRLNVIVGAAYDDAAVHPQLAAKASSTAAASSVPYIDLAPAGAAFPDRDLPWQPPAAHVPWRIPFYPTLADLAVAAAAFSTEHLQRSAIAIVADTVELQRIATQAVETKARVPPTAVTLVADGTPDSAFSSLSGTAAVIVVSRTEAVIAAALRFAATSAATAVIVASDEFVAAQAVAAAASVPANVHLMSGLPGYKSEAGNATVADAYAEAISATVLAFYQLGANTSASAMMETAFRTAALSVGTFSIAPLYSAPCKAITAPTWPHPGGDCQCSKGISAFHALSAAAVKANTSASVFAYRHAGCGPRFVPLEAAPASGLTASEKAAIGASASGGALLIGALTVVVLYGRCRKSSKDNSNAPQDAREAFTIAFTDIQASTKLWASAPELMGEALDAHHELLRRMVEKHNGYEVKTIGDSFMVAFKDPSAGFAFALAVQAELYDHDFGTQLFDDLYRDATREPLLAAGGAAADSVVLSAADYASLWNGLRVRIGVHYGTGNIRFEEAVNGYDYYGTVVNTAARVEGVGHGGQVLITGDLHAVLPDRALAAAEIRDLGPQPLRGLPEPVPLLEALPLAFAHRHFPPLRLDVENAVDEPALNTGPEFPLPGDNESVAGNSTTTVAVTAPEIAADLARRLRLRNATAPRLCLSLFNAVSALLAALKPSHRSDMVRRLAEAWHADSVWSAAQQQRYQRVLGRDRAALLVAVGKVVQASEVTGGHRSGGDDTTSASDFSLSERRGRLGDSLLGFHSGPQKQDSVSVVKRDSITSPTLESLALTPRSAHSYPHVPQQH